jgi:hypothetical protein
MTKTLTTLLSLSVLGCAVSPDPLAPAGPVRGKGDHMEPISLDESERFDGGELSWGIAVESTAVFVEWQLALSGEAEITLETRGTDHVADTVLWVFERQPDRSWSPTAVEGGFNDDDPRFDGELGSFVEVALGEGEYLVLVESFDAGWVRPFRLESSCVGVGCVLEGPSCQELERDVLACGSRPEHCLADHLDAALACCDRYQHAWCY